MMMFVITVKEKAIGLINVKMQRKKEEEVEVKEEDLQAAQKIKEEIKKVKVVVKEVVRAQNQEVLAQKATQSIFIL